MSRSDNPRSDNRGVGAGPVAVAAPPPTRTAPAGLTARTTATGLPAQAAATGPPGRRLRLLAALAGITGAILLAGYFITPALSGWPNPADSPGTLAAYATTHRLLFYGGGWLQATGALLSVMFFLVLLQLSRARGTLAGSVTLIGCALLLSVVLIEAALLEAVPMAAANGDHATVATAFALSNGVFARIFPLAPAPMVFAGIGFTLSGTSIVPRVFARAALLIAALFLIAGLAAVFGTPGLILATVMSVAEAIWIPATAIALARRASS
jgi:hypothetical protein